MPPKQSGTSTSTQKTGYEDWFSNLAAGMGAGFLENPKYAVAGQTLDQQKAAELSRLMAQGAFSTDNSKAITDAGQLGLMAGRGVGGPTSVDQGAYGQRTSVNGDDIMGLANPYAQNVINRTVGRLDRGFQDRRADIDAAGARQAMFGGSGAALQKAELDKNYLDTLGDTVANMESQGWNEASNRAYQNAGLAENSLNRDQNLYLTDANFRESAKARDANLGLQGAQLNLNAQIAGNSATNDTYGRQRQAVSDLYATGDRNQTFTQKNLDVPREVLTWLQSFMPRTGTNEQPMYSNPIEGGLGLAMIGKTMGIF